MTPLQSERLRESVTYGVENVPFYRDRFAEVGVEPSDVRSVEDLLLSPDSLRLVEAGGIERTEVGKVKRVSDHR